MRSLREIYGAPDEVPSPLRMFAVMIGVVVIALVLWLVLPDSAITVAVLAVVVLVAVFGGVWRVMTARQLSRPPGRNPAPPPSTQ